MKLRQRIQLDPSSVTSQIPRIDDFRHDLINIGEIKPKANNNEAKNDNRSFQKHFDKESEYPLCIKYLIELCKRDIEGSKSSRVYYGSYMRKAITRLPPPTADTISRFLFNIGAADTYVFDANVPSMNNIPSLSEMVRKKTGCDIPEKQLYMEKDTMLQLGPPTTSNYIVFVSSNPQINKPQTINPFNMQKNNKKITLRIAKYHRICIIVDILGTEAEVATASKHAEAIVDKFSHANIQEIANSFNPNAPKDDGDKLSTKEKIELEKIMKEVKTSK